MWIPRLCAFLRRLLAPRRAERELHDDLKSYVEMLTDELRASGLPPDEARRRALAATGVESVKESVRDVRAGAWLELLCRDVRYALRGLRRSPGFTATAVITLAIGMGINTTTFSVIDSTLFKPVPYDRPHELVRIVGIRAGRMVSAGMRWDEVAAWRAERALFAGVEVSSGGLERRWRERDEPVIVGAFTPRLPPLLGVTPILGRVFTEAEVNAREPLVIIAEPLWSRAFGRRPDVLGATMTIDDRPLTVIGVMPAAFRYGPGGGGVLMAWIGMPERADPDIPLSGTVRPVFRLRTGLPLEVAQAQATAIAARLQTSWTPRLVPFVESRRTGLRDGVETSMLVLLATAGLVLLVACVNVASLFLARGAGRRHELALRRALGASQARLARLLLAEGMAVAALGGLAAIAMARWTIQAVVALIPGDMQTNLFMVSAPGVDSRVLLFALGTATLVALVSAAWPAVTGARQALRVSMGSAGQIAGGAIDRRRADRLLQAVQVAVCVVLTSVAALFAASFARMLTEDRGFDPDRLGTVSFALPEDRHRTGEARLRAIAGALERVRQAPGVTSAAVGASPASTMMGDLILPGDDTPAAVLAVRTVGVGYFETAGIRLIAGRPFAPSDTRDAPRVAIIDDAGARRVFGTESPIGRRFRDHPARPEATIVGVVETVAGFDFVQRQDRVGVYFVDAQDYALSHFLVRASDNLGATLARVRSVLEAHDPGLRVMSAGAATDRYEDAETFTRPRFYVVLVSMFAVLALVTTAVGLYGLLAHAVGQRQREIGVRVTLGATPEQVRSLVLREAIGPVLTGVASGGLATWWATGVIGSLLYDTGPRDPRALAVAAAALVVVAIVAAIVPLRRATAVDPVHALRLQ